MKLREGNIFTRVWQSVHSENLVPMGSGPRGIWPEGEGVWSREGVSGLSGWVERHYPPNHKSGRYASYWNAFLFTYDFCKVLWNFFFLKSQFMERFRKRFIYSVTHELKCYVTVWIFFKV